MIFTNEEINLLVKLISNEQIHMNKKNSSSYNENEYKKLEELKVKIKGSKNV